MKPRVYLETTIPSYLTAWTSRDLVRAAHQQITREWWDSRRADFDLFVSQAVLTECEAGDPAAAAERLEAVKGLHVLELTPDALTLAQAFVEQVPLPKKATVDALHIALSALNGMDYLLTWNCTHIANAVFRVGFEEACRERNHKLPIICTPEELLAKA